MRDDNMYNGIRDPPLLDGIHYYRAEQNTAENLLQCIRVGKKYQPRVQVRIIYPNAL